MNITNWRQNIIMFFVLSRVALWISGLQFNVNYDFMYFHGVDELESNFWESLLYTHAFNPAMNILAAFDLRLPKIIQVPFYVFVFQLTSLLLLHSMGRILEVFQLKNKVIFYVLALFSLTPAFLYFETLLIYTLPSAALLMLISYQFYKGISENSIKSWLVFFTTCMLLSFVRSSYHLIWIVSVLVGILIIDFKNIQNKLIGFTLPSSLVFIWYYKNYLLFGFFGSSSWGGFNFHFTTTANLSSEEKTQLVEEGKMSPLVKIPIYSGIQAYGEFVNLDDKDGITILDDTHKINGIANYNHSKFIPLSELKMKDNVQYVKLFPFRYLKRVIRGVIDYHNPSTRWHPKDTTKSPHISNRLVIGMWENAYNSFMHFPYSKGVGFYFFLVPIFLYSMIKLSIKFLKKIELSLEEKLLTFITWNIFFLMLVSCLVTYGELERYRFITEGLIWITCLVFLKNHSRYFVRLKNYLIKTD